MFDPAELVRTGNRYTDQFIAAAERLGLESEIIDPTRATAVISGGGRKLAVRAAIVGCNGMVASRISSNKFLTNVRFRNAGFRVPDFELFCTDDYPHASGMFKVVEEFATPRYPVVVKPVRGHGGSHVYAGIEDGEELGWAIDMVWRASLGDVLIEKHIHGQHYRIKLLGGAITDLIVRYPGFVVGNGKSSISELIERKNAHRRARHVPPIMVTERMKRLLARKGKTTSDVLSLGEKQLLCIETNQQLGGECERMPVASIPEETAEYLRHAARVTGLDWLALDYIADDIEDPLCSRSGYINETNSALAPNEYNEGCTIEEYLSQATLVLKRHFAM